MSEFIFTPKDFIESKDDVLLELISSSSRKATIINPEQIPKDREYVVIVPARVKVSKKFLRDTPDNVVFVIDNKNYPINASDNNIKAIQSRKCFYVSDGWACVSDRLPDVRLIHCFYDGSKWHSDGLTLAEYFKKVIPKPTENISDRINATNEVSTNQPIDWNTVFTNAVKNGLELREENVTNCLKKAAADIPNMIKNFEKEKVYDDVSVDMVNELNKYSTANVKWVLRDDCVVLSIDV